MPPSSTACSFALGADGGRAVAGLTASSLLIVRGRPHAAGARDPGDPARRGQQDPDRGHGARAASSSTVLFALGIVFLAFDRPLMRLGRLAAANPQPAPPRGAAAGEASAAAAERARRILVTLGRRWKRALLAGVGRWAFDFVSLLAALAAVGSTPRPALVLLAFCAAQILAQIPVTPGGLGFVEAGLTAMLVAGGCLDRRRGPGDARLPPLLVLAAAARRPRRGGASPAAIRRGSARGSRLTPSYSSRQRP